MFTISLHDATPTPHFYTLCNLSSHEQKTKCFSYNDFFNDLISQVRSFHITNWIEVTFERNWCRYHRSRDKMWRIWRYSRKDNTCNLSVHFPDFLIFCRLATPWGCHRTTVSHLISPTSAYYSAFNTLVSYNTAQSIDPTHSPYMDETLFKSTTKYYKNTLIVW